MMTRFPIDGAVSLEQQVEMARTLRGLVIEIQELWAEMPTEAEVQRLQDGLLPIRHYMQEIAASHEELPSAEELDQLNKTVQSTRLNA